LADKDIAEYGAIVLTPTKLKRSPDFSTIGPFTKSNEQDLLSLAESGRSAEAIAFFHGEALATFRKAATELRQLIDLTLLKAQAARSKAGKPLPRAGIHFRPDPGDPGALHRLALYLWRSFSRPLLDLESRMHRLSANDRIFDTPFQNRRDEIGEQACMRPLQVPARTREGAPQMSARPWKEHQVARIQGRTANIPCAPAMVCRPCLRAPAPFKAWRSMSCLSSVAALRNVASASP